MLSEWVVSKIVEAFAAIASINLKTAMKYAYISFSIFYLQYCYP
jgi:hypothetical protein